MGLFQTTDLRKHLRRGSVWTGLRRPKEDQASKTLTELERQLLQSIDRLSISMRKPIQYFSLKSP
jgi:hypothetical protein